MGSPLDNAPARALPLVKSSELQTNARRTAHAATAHANEAFSPTPKPRPAPPPPRRVETTLGALAAQLSKGPVDEQAFDPGAYLRQANANVVRHTGAGLAGAALKKLGAKR